MIGERENFNQETQYGSLIMRPYNIDGNEINAFYDSSDNLVFVLDNTIDSLLNIRDFFIFVLNYYAKYGKI